MRARGGTGRLSLLLLGLLLVVTAGCDTRKAAPKLDEQAVFAVQAADSSVSARELNAGAESLVERLVLLGVRREEIHVRPRGPGLAVEFPGDRVGARSLRRVARPSTLEVYDLENDLAAPSKTARGEPVPHANLYSLLAPLQPRIEFGGAAAWELFDSSTKELVAGPAPSPDALYASRVARARHIRAGTAPYVAFGVPSATVVVSCGPGAVVCPGVARSTRRSWYLFAYRPRDGTHPAPELTAGDLASAHAEVDPAQGPVVLVDLDARGDRKLRELTRALYTRGQSRRQPQHLAVVIDRELRSMPQIDFTDDTLANGIGGGPLVATLPSLTEARRLALALAPIQVRFTRIR